MGRLAGKVAYVLGAAGRGNMGQVIAQRFAEEGAIVAVGGRHPEELEWLAGEIGGMAVTCDITKMEDIKSSIGAIMPCASMMAPMGDLMSSILVMSQVTAIPPISPASHSSSSG